jgi:hypothetical protein
MNYDFCHELDTPEICVIMDRKWWVENKDAIGAWLGKDKIALGQMMLYIPKPADRTYFMLRWPQ